MWFDIQNFGLIRNGTLRWQWGAQTYRIDIKYESWSALPPIGNITHYEEVGNDGWIGIMNVCNTLAVC